ncbi:MAG: hypothetical protein GF346_06470 [Candidatus Eisenbacteria bacterium]|nr:hypothetical protein [Candidatus Latescibacterota bacterium]MBD3302071.1 hypothetical protein [Candidatus Eisenbacteria bacterium]
MPSLRDTIRELKERNPRVQYEVMEPGQVQRFLTKLGYLGPYDRCKYDVIYFREEEKEKAMVIWGILGTDAAPRRSTSGAS